MFEVQGMNGAQGGHRVTTQRVKSQDGEHTFIRKTVHIGLNEQKWVPKEIDEKKFSSLREIKKQYPNAEEVKQHKDKDGTVSYFIRNKDDIDYSTSIKVKEDEKGSHIEITSLQYPFWVSGKYEDGKLVKADKTPYNDDPYVIYN